jgi:succinoglycan biosynthesis protein ExoW
MPAEIAVVIPHYQRNVGVLARTLGAVFAQEADANLTVIIVDDESPAPAANELGALSDAARGCVRIISRANGGPAAARNTGLAALPANVEFVALLDCDDLWHPRHLTRALAAFQLGYDFYFSDHRREHARESRFSQCGIQAADHRKIDAALDLYAWEGDLFEASLRHTVVGFSTVLYRRSAFPDLRLNEAVGLADDVYFAFEVARATGRVAFSPSEDVLYTDADNASVVTDWRSNKSLRVILSLSLCYRRAMHEFAMTDAQRRLLRKRLGEFRRDFVTTVAAMLSAGIQVEAGYVLQFARHDPAVFGAIPAVLTSWLLRSGGRGS